MLRFLFDYLVNKSKWRIRLVKLNNGYLRHIQIYRMDCLGAGDHKLVAVAVCMVCMKQKHHHCDLRDRNKLANDLQLDKVRPFRKLCRMDQYIFDFRTICPADNLDSQRIRVGIQSMDFQSNLFGIRMMQLRFDPDIRYLVRIELLRNHLEYLAVVQLNSVQMDFHKDPEDMSKSDCD